MVLVNKADETLTVGEQAFELGCNQFPDAMHPKGFQFLGEFARDPLPTWTYEVPGATIQKTLWMPLGQNATVVRYELLGGQEATLSIRPFVTARDYHGTHRFNLDFNTACNCYDDNINSHMAMQPYGDDSRIVWSHADGGIFREDGAWYYNFEYSIERERGLVFCEDAFCPGEWTWRLTRENPIATWVVGVEKHDVREMSQSYETEIARLQILKESVASSTRSDDEQQFIERLAVAADQFVVQRADGLHTVLAGYHWFSDWGRDTMIALPGLTLSTGRYDIARSILLAFAKSSSQGMIPNRFPDAGEELDTNTVDATLWFFHAIAQYVERSGDTQFLRDELYDVLRDSIRWHIEGTRYGIQADERDGLLMCGDSSTQLTWMDAKVGDTVFTPRNGKPVEIQALWYNALRSMSSFASQMNDAPTKTLCDRWSSRAKANFAPTFWNSDGDFLFDCVSNDGSFRDAAIRPNQIFAVSLPHRLLSREQERSVVDCVQRELLTPFGLRSLSPRDSRYRGIYIGDQWQRDSSYHQGTVWAWPLGGFLSAYLRVYRHSKTAKTQVRQWLEPLRAHLDESCIGQINEIFDGDSPHTPRGCCAQAWSVSEPLRVLLDELS